MMLFQIRILLSGMSHTDNPADVADPLLYFIKSQRGPLEYPGCSVTMGH